MLCVISPAKRLDERPKALPEGVALTEPDFPAETWRLVQRARELSVQDLRDLMDLSEPLARLNRDRFAAFRRKPGPGQAMAAVQCFAGDTYAGLEAATMEPDARHWAAGHLRILSGLYGLLRPWDAIQPHRLEMGTRLENLRGPDLYAFWGDRVAKALNRQAAEMGTEVLVNCASVEYFTVAQRKALKLRVITPVFLEERNGEAKIVSFWAKKARGAMARFLCDNHLTDPEALRGFTAGGYGFRADLSEGDRLVFTRAEPQEQAA
ncbi:peroxide stress protein YaaA [Rhodobacter sp. SGA-6-6]|uniref:peroxide stress protein YaaA n=1 Tax=Rhodobacter sp. SGA-6-6 TaxID=2710882 RepID=UPI0013EAC6EA|nr:peroxide stress protein YaaA [Rhodobacter sp. SGA-6-6]NGM44261.1 peroxide stress protein YaaA [Rhodobacter sp. SGA-6-6]